MGTNIHGEQIGVSVKDGVVELDGRVSSYYQKWGAERAALRVTGVAIGLADSLWSRDRLEYNQH